MNVNFLTILNTVILTVFIDAADAWLITEKAQEILDNNIIKDVVDFQIVWPD